MIDLKKSLINKCGGLIVLGTTIFVLSAFAFGQQPTTEERVAAFKQSLAKNKGDLQKIIQHHAAVPILIGTLGKALGGFGAFVAGSDDLIEYIVQRARPYIYTTALPPAVAHATLTGLRLVQEESWRREHLHALITRFRRGAAQLGANMLPSVTPIQPLLVGDSERALALSAALRARSIYVTAIRPPTVPAGTARLRITLSAAHSEAQVDRLLAALEAVL